MPTFNPSKGYIAVNHDAEKGITIVRPTRIPEKLISMTPKEKAQELYNKFQPIVSVWEAEYGYDRVHTKAKSAAIVAVDEILGNNCGYYTDGECATGLEIYCDEHYWGQVKAEIEKI